MDVVKYLKMVNLETGKSNGEESIKLASNLYKKKEQSGKFKKGIWDEKTIRTKALVHSAGALA